MFGLNSTVPWGGGDEIDGSGQSNSSFAGKVRKWWEGQLFLFSFSLSNTYCKGETKWIVKPEFWHWGNCRVMPVCGIFEATGSSLLPYIGFPGFVKGWHKGGLWGTPTDSDLIDLGNGLSSGFLKFLSMILTHSSESQSSSLMLPNAVTTSSMCHWTLGTCLDRLKTCSET